MNLPFIVCGGNEDKTKKTCERYRPSTFRTSQGWKLRGWKLQNYELDKEFSGHARSYIQNHCHQYHHHYYQHHTSSSSYTIVFNIIIIIILYYYHHYHHYDNHDDSGHDCVLVGPTSLQEHQAPSTTT